MIFVLDFDGTITRRDTVDSLLNAFAHSSWKAIEAEWLAGRIDSRRCMTEQLALVKLEQRELMEFLRRVDIDPSFNDFYHDARKIGTPVIVSDGLDLVIEHLMQVGTLPRMPFFANRAEFGHSRLHISFPHGSVDCAVNSGVCKCAVMGTFARRFGGATVLIGDGMSDKCIAGRADYVFAKGALAQYCEEQQMPYTAFCSFADILARLNAQSPVAAGLRATS